MKPNSAKAAAERIAVKLNLPWGIDGEEVNEAAAIIEDITRVGVKEEALREALDYFRHWRTDKEKHIYAALRAALAPKSESKDSPE